MKQKKQFTFIEFLLSEFVKTVIDVVLKRFSSGFEEWGCRTRGEPEHPAGTGVAARGCGEGRGARAPTFFFLFHPHGKILPLFCKQRKYYILFLVIFLR